MKLFTKFIYPLVFFALVVTALNGCEKQGASLPEAKLNERAPMFSLLDFEGNRVELASLQGRVVFINFWATWCPPCREEMPSMLRLNQKLKDKPFTLITILMNDDPANAKAFYKSIGGSLPTLLDPDGAVAFRDNQKCKSI